MSSTAQREQFLVICALGENSIEFTHTLCKLSHEYKCAITSSRLTQHGTHGALVLQVSGSWDALARFENTLPQLAKKHQCTISCSRSHPQQPRPEALPYVAYVSSAYRSDILNELCQFFVDHKVHLEDLNCDTHLVPQTGGTILNITLTVTLPPNTQISWLRDQFLDFAEAFNLDALLEPWRPQQLS